MRFESTNCKHVQRSYRQLGYSNRFECNKTQTHKHIHIHTKQTKALKRCHKETNNTHKPNYFAENTIFCVTARIAVGLRYIVICYAWDMLSPTNILLFNIIYSSILYWNKRMCDIYIYRMSMSVGFAIIALYVLCLFVCFFLYIWSHLYELSRDQQITHHFHSDSISIDCDAGSAKSTNKSI